MRINRKEAICDAAAQLFNEKGYDQVSMREIAKQAGTTIGNLTYYFPKKEDIVIQIVSELHEDFQIYLKMCIRDSVYPAKEFINFIPCKLHRQECIAIVLSHIIHNALELFSGNSII